MQGNYVKLLHLKTVSRENVTDEPRLEALRARIPHTNFHSMSGVLGIELWTISLPSRGNMTGRGRWRRPKGVGGRMGSV